VSLSFCALLNGVCLSRNKKITYLLTYLLTYATQCKEAGMAVSQPPGQSCHVVKLHWTAGSEQRYAETKS